MRLTLRTLLAYLDDILDPADKEQLAQKIESSEFAEDLVHRTRDTVRRLRLSAPQVIGSGMGLDPNTVAEYLDNVLPPESVGDFERICLESDMHLAEAAACHHVLTMVLGEPADVDPIMRQRMYSIPGESEARKHVRVEAPHVAVAAAPAGQVTEHVVAAPAVVLPPTSDGEGVPEYLRASAWTGIRKALLAIAAVVLVGTGLVLFGASRGWFGTGTGTVSLAGETESALAPNNTGPSEPVTTPIIGGQTADQTHAAAPSVPPLDIAPAEPQPLDTPPAEPAESQIEPTVQSDSAARAAEAVPHEATQLATPNPIQDQAPSQSIEGPVSPYDEPPLGQQPTANIPESMPANVPAEPLITDETATDSVAADSTAGAAPAEAATTSREAMLDDAAASESPLDTALTDVEEVPAGPVELGTYLGGKTVLLRYDDEAGAWFRVQPRSAVIAGSRLLSLPEFRPKITLASGVHVDVSGGTQVTMRTADELPAEGLPTAGAAEPALDIHYGRVIMINTSGEEQPVRLALGSNIVAATLARNATLAIEVQRKHVPGADAQKSPAPVIVRLFAPDGGIEWHDAAGTKIIDNVSRWSITDGANSDIMPDSSPPNWIDQEPVVQLSEQRYGAPVVEGTLTSDKPADIQLIELFHGNTRKEVKSLAAKSSIHVGVFEPFIEALRDSEQKANWRAHIETLRSAMALSPDSAGNVWRALVEQRGQSAAADLYEMLCGYNEEQIGQTPDEARGGALVRLIDWLENDSLDYRVLAWQNLWETTGKRLMPDPSANLNERTQNVRQWRRRLDSGELRFVGQP